MCVCRLSRACEKAGPVTATLTATGPVRWFLNNKLVAESKRAGDQKATMTLSAGMNCLLAKSWKADSEWKVGCALEGLPVTFETVQRPPSRLIQQRVDETSRCGRRAARSPSVASCGRISAQRARPEHAQRRPRDTGWTSLEVDRLPQWAWVRFPGLRQIDEVVVHAASAARRPLELVGEYTDDGGVTFKNLFRVTDPKEFSIRENFPAVVTDNVRIRIERVAVPERSGFAQAQLTEIEVFGDDVPGSGSLAG